MFPVTDTSYRGLMIYNLDVDFYQIYDGTAWISPTSIMAMTAGYIPKADGTGNALIDSTMSQSGTKITQAGAMDITGVAGLLGGANLNSQKITSLLAGTVSTDAINKAQLDAVAATIPVVNTIWTYASGAIPPAGSENPSPPTSGTYLVVLVSNVVFITVSGANTASVRTAATADGGNMVFFTTTGSFTVTNNSVVGGVYNLYGIRGI